MRKGEATRQAILGQALPLARRGGLFSLSIGDLAEHIGMSKSGLYAHFKSKQTLQLAVMRRNREDFVVEVIRPALAEPRGSQRLRALVANWMTWFSHPGGCLFLAAASDFDDRPGAVRDQMIADELDLRDSLRQVLATLVETGELREDADLHRLSQEVFGILLGYNWFARILSDPTAAETAWAALDRLLQQSRPAHT